MSTTPAATVKTVTDDSFEVSVLRIAKPVVVESAPGENAGWWA